MRLLYLIGNGFDLHVGLHTAYTEFLQYYLKQPVPDSLDNVGQRYIKRLKEDIQGNITLWSDLEIQYGKHMSKLGTIGSAVHSLEEELDIINDDIREKLSAYIAKEDEKSIFAEKAKKRFLEDIVKPEAHLRDYEKVEIQQRKNNSNWYRTANIIDFVTFNYTRTIEHLLGNTPLDNAGYRINEPVHVHGYHNQRMILGVNDISQIENEQLRKLTYATDVLVKSDNNHAYGVLHTDECNSLISNAQLICCYGLSFGDTDKMWWQKVCNELRNRSEIIIILFVYISDIPDYSNSGHKLQQRMRQIKDVFLAKGGIEEPDKHKLAQRVFVTINDPIFNVKIDDRSPMD